MADAKNIFIHPGLNLWTGFTATNFALDQTTDQMEWIFQAKEAATITRLGFRYGSRTGTPPTYKISLQGVDGSGNPDGTIKGGGSPASKTFTPPADATWDGTWRWHTLDNTYTCANGEALSIVIAYSSGTVDGANMSSITSVDTWSMTGGSLGGAFYAQTNNAGARSRSSARAVFAYSSASHVYGQPIKAGFSSASTTQTTTPDEYASRFILPAGCGTSYKISGVYTSINWPNVRTAKLQLYSGTTILQTRTVDTDTMNFGSQRGNEISFDDTTLATLTFGTEYRIGIQPQDAAGGYLFLGATQDSNAEWEPYPLGTDWYLSSRTDLGAWTDDTTSRLAMSLILKEITGGGGPVGSGRLSGGFQ